MWMADQTWWSEHGVRHGEAAKLVKQGTHTVKYVQGAKDDNCISMSACDLWTCTALVSANMLTSSMCSLHPSQRAQDDSLLSSAGYKLYSLTR